MSQYWYTVSENDPYIFILKDANVIKLTCSGLMPILASFTSIVVGRGEGDPSTLYYY